jgi:hypothetical protein
MTMLLRPACDVISSRPGQNENCVAVETSGIDHIHLNVSDIQAAIERFTAILDCEHNLPLYIDSIQALNSMNTLGVDVFEPREEGGIAARQMARFGTAQAAC